MVACFISLMGRKARCCCLGDDFKGLPAFAPLIGRTLCSNSRHAAVRKPLIFDLGGMLFTRTCVTRICWWRIGHGKVGRHFLGVQRLASTAGLTAIILASGCARAASRPHNQMEIRPRDASTRCHRLRMTAQVRGRMVLKGRYPVSILAI